MAKTQESISAPQFDRYLQIAQSQPVITDLDVKEKLFLLYKMMKNVAVSGNDEYRNIWFYLERGTIKYYGNFKKFLEEGYVDNYADFEEMWLFDYPETTKWYNFAVAEFNDEYYFYIDSKLTFKIAKENHKYLEEIDIKPIINCLEKEIKRNLDWLQEDEAGYNFYLNQNLSYCRRTGKILRKNYWKISPFNKKLITKGISKKEISILKNIVAISNNNVCERYLSVMTAGMFFDFCKMGYEANNYFKGRDMSGKEMYRAMADGRNYGLTDIDLNSPEAFNNWYFDHSRIGGHPWEICRGGNSTHISLYVENKSEGWFLRLAGNSAVRVNETVKFALALYNNQVPFVLQRANEIYKMISGIDFIGLVPQEVFPRYCHSLFPKENEQIIDFMNLEWEEADKIISLAEWYPIEIQANNLLA